VYAGNSLMGMLFSLAVLYIIFGSIFGRLPGFSRPGRRERRALHEHQEEADRQTSELLEQLAQLEERVKVLERIVTDDSHDLRRQFRDLG